MNTNVLLINPWIYDFAAYDFWSKPLGLLYMAGILRKNSIGVQLIDCMNPVIPVSMGRNISRNPGGKLSARDITQRKGFQNRNRCRIFRATITATALRPVFSGMN